MLFGRRIARKNVNDFKADKEILCSLLNFLIKIIVLRRRPREEQKHENKKKLTN